MQATQRPVLMVEDDPLLCRAVCRDLARLAWIVPVGSLEAADRTLHESADCIGMIVDVALPDGSGLDWLSARRAAGCLTPAVIATAHHEPELANDAFAMNASYLCKPFPMARLHDFVSRLVLRDLGTSEAIAEALTLLARERRLTRAELDVVSAALRGQSREAFLEARQISVNTHKAHVRSALKKLDAESLAEVRNRVLQQVSAPAAASKK